MSRFELASVERTFAEDFNSFSFDVDYPLDVDDEYWDTGNPQTDFKQPPGKPSKIAMYISLLSLERIVASAIMNVVRSPASMRSCKSLKTDLNAVSDQYTVNKAARCKEPDNPEHQKKLIADLDSDLYAWLDSVPAHLKWDSEREDPEMFQQSAVLYCNYYFAQVSLGNDIDVDLSLIWSCIADSGTPTFHPNIADGSKRSRTRLAVLGHLY